MQYFTAEWDFPNLGSKFTKIAFIEECFLEFFENSQISTSDHLCGAAPPLFNMSPRVTSSAVLQKFRKTKGWLNWHNDLNKVSYNFRNYFMGLYFSKAFLWTKRWGNLILGGDYAVGKTIICWTYEWSKKLMVKFKSIWRDFKLKF